MDRPRLLLPAALAVTVLGAGCGKRPSTQAPPPVTIDAVAATPPDAAPPDAGTPAVYDPPDYPVG